MLNIFERMVSNDKAFARLQGFVIGILLANITVWLSVTL